MINIFGYGSLINIDSLKETFPNIDSIQTAILDNYQRVFETKSSKRFTKDGKSISVLNLKKKKGAKTNGVIFQIQNSQLKELIERESAYKVIEIEISKGSNDQKIKAYTFIDDSGIKQEFIDDQAQMDYLRICLEGANNFGTAFLESFLETTFIAGKNLKEKNIY